MTAITLTLTATTIYAFLGKFKKQIGKNNWFQSRRFTWELEYSNLREVFFDLGTLQGIVLLIQFGIGSFIVMFLPFPKIILSLASDALGEVLLPSLGKNLDWEVKGSWYQSLHPTHEQSDIYSHNTSIN